MIIHKLYAIILITTLLGMFLIISLIMIIKSYFDEKKEINKYISRKSEIVQSIDYLNRMCKKFNFIETAFAIYLLIKLVSLFLETLSTLVSL